MVPTVMIVKEPGIAAPRPPRPPAVGAVQIDRNIAKERMVAATGAFFSLLGLLLVSTGDLRRGLIHGRAADYRTGIRMALGLAGGR